MIESQNPDIDVSLLNQKIEEALAKQTPVVRGATVVAAETPESAARLAKLDSLEALVADANINAHGPQRWPQKLDRFPFVLAKGGGAFALRLYRFLLKKQTVVNLAFVRSLQEVIRLLRQSTYLEVELREAGDRLSLELQAERAQREQLSTELQAERSQREQLSTELQAAQSQRSQLEQRLQALEAQVLQQSQLRDGQQQHYEAERQQLALERHAAQTRLIALEQQVQGWDRQFPALQQQSQTVSQMLLQLKEQSLQGDRFYKESFTQQQRLLTLLFEQASAPTGEAATESSTSQGLLQESQRSQLDPFYAAFEDHFRGERSEIMKRLEVYLPCLEKQKTRALELPAIDLGCGRGEWLSLLNQEGYQSIGVDLNQAMVDRCRSRDIAAHHQDAIAYLKEQPNASASLVTAFHLIEHLPLATLIELLGETQRVLAPGGMAIFETPNPQNFMVGACNFYADPTHINPVFPPSAQFMMDNVGFAHTELMFVNPVMQTPFDHRDEPEWQILRSWFYGPRDYSVLGYKE